MKSGASSSAPPASPRDFEAERISAQAGIVTLLPPELADPSLSAPNGPPVPKYPSLAEVISFEASLIADLILTRNFRDNAAWIRAIGVPTAPWLKHSGASVDGPSFADSVRQHFLAIDQAKYAPAASTDDDEGELLCNTVFSLAYGALLLLSHTTLRLVRGRRYGILGPNGSGKSTLMRQLRDGKVENFPPQDQLRCVMVEHSLQGEDASLPILDFIASGELPGAPCPVWWTEC